MLQSMGLNRVRHNLVTEQQKRKKKKREEINVTFALGTEEFKIPE